jgi:hypothetical protein
VTGRYEKMVVHIKASNEEGHGALRETNRICPACMKEAGKRQNAKRQKKMDLFYIILFFVLILLAVLRVAGPVAITVWNLLLKS